MYAFWPLLPPDNGLVSRLNNRNIVAERLFINFLINSFLINFLNVVDCFRFIRYVRGLLWRWLDYYEGEWNGYRSPIKKVLYNICEKEILQICFFIGFRFKVWVSLLDFVGKCCFIYLMMRIWFQNILPTHAFTYVDNNIFRNCIQIITPMYYQKNGKIFDILQKFRPVATLSFGTPSYINIEFMLKSKGGCDCDCLSECNHIRRFPTVSVCCPSNGGWVGVFSIDVNFHCFVKVNCVWFQEFTHMIWFTFDGMI